MAKAKDIDIHPWEPYGLAAARIVRARTEELFAQEEGVLDTSDIERVHDMRVATRRLRAVLEIFAPCFPRADYKAVLGEVKALADALGERRDPDVHIDAMVAFGEQVLATQRRGVDTLVASLRERQAVGNETLAAALTAARESRLREGLLALADAAEAAQAT